QTRRPREGGDLYSAAYQETAEYGSRASLALARADSGTIVLPSDGHREIYSITSSAIARTPDGIVSPSVFAVLRLMRNSNASGLSIGRSLGLAPLRMRPA